MLNLSSEKNFKINSECCILYFYAPWLIYNKKFFNMISSYESENEKIEFIAIDVEHHKNLKDRYKINSIPTLVALYNGKEVARSTGMMLASAFKHFCNKHKERKNVRIKSS